MFIHLPHRDKYISENILNRIIMLKNFRMTQIHTWVFYGLSYFVVEVVSCSCHAVTCMRPSPVLKQGSLTKSVSFRVNWCHNLSIQNSVCYSHSSSQQHWTSLQLSARKLHDEGKQMLQMDSDGWWVSGDDLISWYPNCNTLFVPML